MKRINSTLLAITGLLVMLAIPTGASAEVGPWTKTLDVAKPSSQPDAQVAAGPDGSTTAVWTQPIAGKSEVLAVTKTPSGSFEPPVEVSEDGAEGRDNFDPLVATGSDGTTAIIWRAFDGQNESLEASIRPPGDSFQPPETVYLPAGSETFDQANLTVGPDGSVTVVWSQSITTSSGNDEPAAWKKRAATRPPGGGFEAPVDISEPGVNIWQGYGPSAITSGPDGSTTAAWMVYRNNKEFLQTSTRPPGGSFAAPLEEAGEASSIRLELLSGPDGTTTAVWGDDSRPMVSTRPPGGSFGQAIDVSQGLGGFGVDAAVGEDGTVAVTWPVVIGESRIIRVTTRSPGGSFGTPVDVSSPDAEALLPAVGVAGDGKATVIWREEAGVLREELKASAQLPGGGFSPPATLGEIDDFDLNGQQIAVNESGAATVVWAEDQMTTNYVTDRFARIAVRPAGGEFGEADDLSTASQGSDPALSTGGDSVIAWKQSSASGDVIRSATRGTEKVRFGEPVELSGFGQITSGPEVSNRQSGSATVAWAIENGGFDRIQAAHRPGASAGFAAPQTVSPVGRNAELPVLAEGPGPVTTLVWQQDDPSGTNVYAAETDTAGTFGSPVLLGEGLAGRASPQIATGSGIAAVAWTSDEGAVEVATRTAGGSFGTPSVIGSPVNFVHPPRVVVDGQRGVDVVWRDSASGTDRILMSRGNTSGQFPAPSSLAQGPSFTDPQIAAGDASAAVLWVDQAPGGNEVRASIRDQAQDYGEPVTVPSTSEPTDPSLAVTPDGSVITAWWNSPDSSREIETSVRPPSGQFPRPTQISDDYRVTGPPVLAMSPDGLATATWQRDNRYIQFSSTTVPFKPQPGAQCPKQKPRLKGPIRLKQNRAVLRVATSGGGRVTAAGSRALFTKSVKVGPSGRAVLKLRPKRPTLRRLAKKRSITTKVRVTFRSVFDCPPRSVAKRIRIIGPAR